jgi:hypothetical protein
VTKIRLHSYLYSLVKPYSVQKSKPSGAGSSPGRTDMCKKNGERICGPYYKSTERGDMTGRGISNEGPSRM